MSVFKSRYGGRLASAVLILAAMLNPAARAQTSTAAVTGHVVDQSNGAVPNATVRLVEQSTRVAVSTQSNAKGDFNFNDVQPGTYTAIVTAPGYKELQKRDLVLYASVNLDASVFTLQVGAVAQSVTIEADVTPLQTTSSERSSVLDTQQVENLLSIGRDVMAMTKVMPGVVENSDGASSLGTTGAPVVNGVNNEYSMSTIDGVIGNTRGLNTLDTPANLDAVNEVTVNQSNYTAQYGGEAGGGFNFVTKNGTNRFHGSLYEYFRNEDLNANAWFNKYNGVARPRYRYNVLGGTIGGPVFWPGHFNRNKDKLFFFVSVDDEPINTPDGLKYYTVPTLLQSQGNFTQTYNQGTSTQSPSTLINVAYPGQSSSAISGGCPVNGASNTNCVPGNVIPSAYINPQTQALLTIMYNNTLGNSNLGKNSTQAFTNTAISDNNYNYITNYSAGKPVNQEIFRVDYAATDKLHMFFRGELTTVNDNDYSSPANDLPWLMQVNYKNTEPNFVYNIVYTFTPTLVNEFNIGTAGWSEHQLYAKSALDQVTLGNGGFNLPSLYAGVNPLNLFPAAMFGGVTNTATYNWDSRFPMADQVRSYNATDKVTKVLGNHTFVLGIDAGTDWYLQANHNRVGTFKFDHDTSDPNDTNFAYANANMGVIDTYTQDTQLVNYAPRTNRMEWYYQDTWKARHNLTLDFGIRNSWAMAQRLARGDNFVPSLYNSANAPTLYQYDPLLGNPAGTGAVNPLTGATVPKSYAGLMVPNTGNLNNGILYVNTPGYPQGTVYGNGVKWAPRFGFAWSFTPNTVLRGGFGLFYNVRARSGQEGDLTNNAPTTNGPTQYYSSATSTASNYYDSPGVSNLNGPFGVSHAIPLHGGVPYAEEGSLGIQRQLGWGTVLDVAYVGTFTKHASDYTPINEVPYGAEFQASHQYCSAVNAYGCSSSSILADNFFRPYQGLGTINQEYFNLTANYNSLQVKVTRRFRNGLEFGGAYTWGRAMDYTDSYNGTVALYQNLRQWNYGPAGWDLKHMLVINYLYSLPRASHAFGDSSSWNNVVTRQAFDHWKISGFATYYSGAPGTINLSLSNSQNVTGGGDGARVVLTCDPWHQVHGTRSFHQWFNTACVEPPIAGSAATVGTYSSKGVYTAPAAATSYSTGTGAFSPKVNFFLPGDVNFETALVKDMPIENKVTMELRLETYNTFNHPEFNGLNNSGTTTTTATATFANANSQGSANPQTAGTFGQLWSAQNPRYVQLALRLDF
ncbi:MAG TPA: carboxypeptidase regulatory-like domain-containing protein [Terracidiphilus sp.]|jgi:hypothetical protein